MNEFRLYWYDRGRNQYLPFVIRQPQGDLFRTPSLLDNTEEARLAAIFSPGFSIATRF